MKNAAGGKETQALLLSTLGLERHENVCGELHGKYLRGKEQTDFAIRWYTIKDSTKRLLELDGCLTTYKQHSNPQVSPLLFQHGRLDLVSSGLRAKDWERL